MTVVGWSSVRPSVLSDDCSVFFYCSSSQWDFSMFLIGPKWLMIFAFFSTNFKLNVMTGISHCFPRASITTYGWLIAQSHRSESCSIGKCREICHLKLSADEIYIATVISLSCGVYLPSKHYSWNIPIRHWCRKTLHFFPQSKTENLLSLRLFIEVH